jgi:Flp pilus assembly protein TadG
MPIPITRSARSETISQDRTDKNPARADTIRESLQLRRLRTPARPRRRRWCRALKGDERGSVSAELVLATPLLLVLIMGVVQFALWEHATHVADAVAQQGLAVGRLQGETAAAGQAEAQSVLDQLGTGVLVAPDITATRTATTTTVVVTGHAESVFGLFSLPVTAVASGPTEDYAANLPEFSNSEAPNGGNIAAGGG